MCAYTNVYALSFNFVSFIQNTEPVTETFGAARLNC
ncbi:hypothetical protein SAMN05216516_11512 [Izhakiella capsodis]|uniref:Uncharacterized protein n=1 Tax=Izhakiella capsodis TaxID=1367852 RepID=A0A1I5B7W9_9GAMM|nr:hypothetical protein SAMN05216516_11512 [Izhakiella capsodis]